MKKRLCAAALVFALILSFIPIYDVPVKATGTQKVDIINATTNIPNNWAEGAGYGIANVYDGERDGKQFMSAAYSEATLTDDAYVNIELPGAYAVSSIDLYTILDGAGFPTEFKIFAYIGEQWTEVKTGTDSDLEVYTAGKTSVAKYTFDAVECSQLRITTKTLGKHDSQYFFEVREIEVYGEPASDTIRKLDITSATTNIPNTWAEGAGYGIANVYDGERDGKQFMSAKHSVATLTDDAYVDIELSGAFAVSSIDLYSLLDGLGCPTEFTILAYVGEEWKKVAAGTTSDLEVYTAGKTSVAKYTFEAVECSRLRIATRTLGNGGDGYYFELREVEVYGKPIVETAQQLEITSATTNIPNTWAEGAGYGIVNVYDGERDGKQFMSAASSEAILTEDAYVDISLSNLSLVSGIDLYALLDGIGFPTEYKILAYVGEAWEEIATGTTADLETYTAGKTSVAKYTFEQVECSYLRIATKKLGKHDADYYFELREVEVFGTPTDLPPNTPTEGNPPSGDGGDTPNIPGDARVNAALNGTVQMNCPEWAMKAFYPERLVDGIKTPNNMATTLGYQDQKTTETITVLFKNGAYAIDQINLVPCVLTDSPKSSFPIDFTVSVWNGSKWVQVAKKTGYKNDGSTLELKFSSVVCNAVRVTATKLGESDKTGEYTLRLSEIEALGKKSSKTLAKPTAVNGGGNTTNKTVNAALNGTVQMNCPDWALRAFGPDRLVDGIKASNNMATTPGYKDKNTTETITVVFKDGAYAINQINLVPCVLTDSPKSSFPIDFTVSVWNGSKWVQVAKKTGYKNDGSTLELKFSSVVCNAVRVTATKLGESDKAGEYTLRLSEIEALGKKSSKTLAKPTVTTGGGNNTTNTTTSPMIDHSKNIALNCPAKASSDLALYNAGVANINDGNENTFFASDNKQYVEGEPQWVEINLLKNYSINKVALLARHYAWGFPYDFTISVFYDDVWTDVVVKKNFKANETSGLIEMYEFSFPAIVGNKIRISSSNFRNAGTDASFCMNEMVVYGTVAKGDYVLPNENVISSTTTITATSSLEDYGYFLSNLIDGDLTTEWSSDAHTEENAEQVLEFDLKNVVQLGEIQIKPSSGGHGFPVDFTISVCQNGRWVEVYSATDYEKPVNEAIQRFTFEPREVSKFKITVTKLASVGGVYACKFNEVMAYPYATGEDFDLDQIVEVDYERTYAAAEVVPSTEKNVILQWWKVISGAVIMLAALSGMIAMLVMLKKKTNENQ